MGEGAIEDARQGGGELGGWGRAVGHRRHVLLEKLQARGAQVAYHDPYVPVIRPTREHAHWTGTKSVAWNKETIAGYDLVLISTNHACVNYQELASWAKCIVDTRNAMNGIPTAPRQVWKA